MVLPLETQHAVRQVATALHGAADAAANSASSTAPVAIEATATPCALEDCSVGHSEVMEGARLTVWAISAHAEDGSCMLEPLAARRADSTPGSLAVEPVEMTMQRQVATETSTNSPGVALRYGEGFRLRMAGSSLCLSHGAGALRWERSREEWPRNSRFAAHGGELGAPVHFGRRLTLQRVPSPEPECESDSESSSDSGQSESERLLVGHHRREYEKRWPGLPPGTRPRTAPTPPTDASACHGAGLHEGPGILHDSEVSTGLFSRVADAGTALPVTFLPVV